MKAARTNWPVFRSRRTRTRRQRKVRRRQEAGALVPNTAQPAYFADVARRLCCRGQGGAPSLRAGVLVARSRMAPSTNGRQPQHPDARNNGRLQLAARTRTPKTTAQLRKALDDLGSARHHQHQESRRPRTSRRFRRKQEHSLSGKPVTRRPKAFLPMGFLAIDLVKRVNLPLFDPNTRNARIG